MTFKLFSPAILFVFIFAGSVSAQFTQDPNDAGVADTVDIVFSVIPIAASNQLQVQMDLWFFNDSNNTVSSSMGFAWDNPNLQMDSAKASPLAQSAFNFLLVFFEGQNINTTNANQRFPFAGSRISGNGVEMSPSRKLIASYFFTLSSWTIQDVIMLDTLAYNAGTFFKLVDGTNTSRVPFWTGKKVIRDPDFVNPSNLVVSPDTLFYASVEGSAPPAPQSFTIDSDFDPLSFSLFESAPWITKSPASGTTPATINVSLITAGLSAGQLFDSIRIDASGADNAPLYKYVQLDLSPPPPTISVAPLSFSFNAIAGGSNPASRTLTITNSGGSSLNWSVSNTQSWLQLTPFTGIDSGDVTLSVDILGLPFNTYFDTIVVSDPSATNDPVRVPVQLTVASDLPLIEVDSTFNIFIVPTGTPLFFDRTFEVRNGGGGSMNFRVTHTPGRIQSVTPDSGSAPSTVTVNYKQSVIPGLNLFDTLWVFSDEASNSPVMVITLLHLVDQPAVLAVDKDSLKFHLFECGQGLTPQFQSQTFGVVNTGGDDPLEVMLIHESSIFQVGPMFELAPTTFSVTLKDTLPPVGTYIDTVEVTAHFSLNKVDTVILRLDVTEAAQTPMITPTDSVIVISYEETTAPQIIGPITVFNQFGGCMPWALSESIPWLTPTSSGGNVEDGFSIVVDAAGFTFGESNGTISLISGAAGNSPFDIPVQLLVWRRGDWDFNGATDITDLTSMITYLFIFDNDPSGPSPVNEVGDIDCDGDIDIEDLTEFINHLFINFPPLNCGL